VFGSDGAKIGEVNGVKSDDAGKVQEILVTDGVPAGMNAKVFAITADKITSVGDGVKLSLSSEEAKKLPIIDNSNG
jgi:sporulation protein YlmC with PRC-barrel domain